MYYSNKSKKNLRKRKRNKAKVYIISSCIILLSVFLGLTYYFDKIVTPTVRLVASTEMRAQTAEIINKNVLEVYSKDFNYNDLIKVEKDNEGNIIMIKADTMNMNKIANEVAIKSQKEIKEIGAIGVDMPIGYITKSNLFSHIGPKVKVKMEPQGVMETSYDSSFESAGINQTRHKIYVNFNCKINVIMPFNHNDIEVKNVTPIAETIIVGKVPRTSLNLDSINGK